MIDALFEASISDVLDSFVTDQRLKDALFGQGVIGTFAGPEKDPDGLVEPITSRATWRARARCGGTSRAAWA